MFVGIAKIEFIKRIENIGLGLNVDPVSLRWTFKVSVKGERNR